MSPFKIFHDFAVWSLLCFLPLQGFQQNISDQDQQHLLQTLRFSSATQPQPNKADMVLISLKLPIRKYSHVFPVPCQIQAGAVFPAMGLGLVWSMQIISCPPSIVSQCSLKNRSPGEVECFLTVSLSFLACFIGCLGEFLPCKLLLLSL